ncbi:MAG: spore cortex biosynthesis protein YabQ [Clostridia bacterium]|nr:spore cortex biosynthesis protein YabQ [Clostridia bacterium]
MELTTQQQTMAFFWAFLLGAALEIVYFAMIILRTASPPGKIAVFVGDTLYMLFVALLNFLFAVSQTEGKIRLYVIFAECLSFGLLYFTVGRWLKQLFASLVSAAMGAIHRFNAGIYGFWTGFAAKLRRFGTKNNKNEKK